MLLPSNTLLYVLKVKRRGVRRRRKALLIASKPR